MNQLSSAVFQTQAAPQMSKRYVTVSTPDVMEIMRNEGFAVQSQVVDRVRKSDPSYARHMVIFQNEALKSADERFTPQAIWVNSYNGRSRASMRLGIYRFICSNGLVVGNDYADANVKHMGDLAKQVIDRIREMSKETQQVFAKIDKWSKIDLSKEQRNEFAHQARILRFGDKSEQYSLDSILEVRRAGDDAGDLWSVFNVVQENTVKGGMVGQNANGRHVRAKKINSIDMNIGYNKKLWELAETFA